MSDPESQRAMEALRKQAKEKLKKEMAIIKSIKETMIHNRKTCTCEGCHNYALISVIMQNGRWFEVVPTWDDFTPEEYWRSNQRYLQYKIDKRPPDSTVLIKKMVEKGIPENQAKIIVEQMLGAIHSIFYKPPPMGLMREI